MSHIGCKYLDYEEGKYTDCEIVTSQEGWKWWRRGKTWTEGKHNEGNPVNVQFCKKRGRINSIFECINKNEMSCFRE